MEIEAKILRKYLSALRQAADQINSLRTELEALGAIQTEYGDWLYPFYLDGDERYLPRDDWIEAQKMIGKYIKAQK